MIVTTPYLIQRGRIVNPLAEADTKLSEAVGLDYMGSAEFEFGALPKSLRRMQAAALNKRVIGQITDAEGSPLRVISCIPDEQWNEYLSHLFELRAGKHRTKEATRFEANYKPFSEFIATDFWWNINNDVMFSFHKQFMNRLPDYLQASWTYMNERKRIN